MSTARCKSYIYTACCTFITSNSEKLAKSSPASGSTLYTAHFTLYITYWTYSCTCTYTRTLHTTHWALPNANHTSILHVAHLSLQTVKTWLSWVSREWWPNEHWSNCISLGQSQRFKRKIITRLPIICRTPGLWINKGSQPFQKIRKI